MDTAFICVGTFSLTVACIFFTDISSWFRNKLHKSVQCWFCHVGSRVKYVDSNNWTCPSCGQYNGFSKDGGYNQEIPSQYDDSLNFSATTFSWNKTEFKPTNSLCPQCNYNQDLKIKQLAAFIPLSESNYDQEIEHYRLQLEKSYKLCSKCEQLVSNVISSQKYVFPGPRRLAQLTRKISFKSFWTLYASVLLSTLMISNRILTSVKIPYNLLPLADEIKEFISNPFMSQILYGLGVVIHTLQCCQLGSYWSLVSWLVWAVMASSPHLLQSQRSDHVAFVQIVICVSHIISSLIILARRKKMQNMAKKKDEKRRERRKIEDSAATWTCYDPNTRGFDSLEERNHGRQSPVRLSPSSIPKSEAKNVDKRNLLKPVPRAPITDSGKRKDDLDLSTLSISSKTDNPFNKSTSPWERVTVTRSSSFSSGISSLRASPCSWKTSQNWPNSSENSWPKNKSNLAGVDGDWSKSSLPKPNFHRQNEGWSPVPHYGYENNWESMKSPWPTQIYSYPVAYAWPNMSPNLSMSSNGSNSRQDTVVNDNKAGGNIFTSLPTIILATTNACLVYYILNSKT